MPRIQSEQRRDDIQPIRREQGDDNVSENLVTEDFAGIEVSVLRDRLDTRYSQIHYDQRQKPPRLIDIPAAKSM